MLGAEGGSGPGGGELLHGRALGIGQWELHHTFCCLFCIFLLSVLLLLLFASFAVLWNYPYPDPRVLPFSSDSPSHPSRGRGDRATAWPFVWSFVAGQRQTTTVSIPNLKSNPTAEQFRQTVAIWKQYYTKKWHFADLFFDLKGISFEKQYCVLLLSL